MSEVWARVSPQEADWLARMNAQLEAADAQFGAVAALSRTLLLEKLSRLLRDRQEALWLAESREPTPIYSEVVAWDLSRRMGVTFQLDDRMPTNVIRFHGRTVIDIHLGE